ncbi:4Fe-4S dicluster domain-containing protein [Aliarcobacter cibarius]|uniref:4Fe-4S dicluster domain-containing protein n=1 Tax=Aliarcobacter cibarius TaxID=255507 RepID=A0A5J6RJC7_9BACT|nr:4Fe-4S binding protein [Aliarcobacter cibarius]QEZ88858.1 [4Fe-4S] dicluster domain-containing protein [Aliarcobacter cibarius]QKJ26899.1 [4Fe-4S] dicluster domain-containing protein [Aliarcobacter cibarius]TLS97475.1 4Fe-4S dicluster domain-containing protein [Aliarcobacter cibarius]TLS98032.1 4Fe-4S dicluster domain-containing protein [Aliarcobacter cibarius]
MQDFIYYNKNGLDFPVSEKIQVTTSLDGLDNQTFLISNTKDVKSEFVANEIDFYIKNSQDNLPNKISNVLELYEIAVTKYDLSQDISYSQEISKELLVVTNSEEQFKEFTKYLNKDDFDIYKINENILKSIEGHIGNLKVTVDSNGKDVVLNVSQIVWFDAKEEGLKQSGTFDPNLSSIEEVISEIKNNLNSYSYKKFTTYDKTICQYDGRRNVICGKCEEVCPTVAITKDDTTKTLTFSQIDCHGCGGCISVCPSGALDYAPTNKESLFEVSKFYKNKHPLIIPKKMDIENLEINLKEGVFPFAIEGEKFLHESSLLTLLQMSGSQIIFYSDFLSKGTNDAIRILNDICQKRYQKDAILVAMNKEELEIALKEVSFIENSYFNFNQEGLKKREIFSHRLQKIVANDNLGEVKTGEHIHYGKVEINQDTCTLCLVCVGACNVDALIAEPKDNTLRFNPSLCTSCGYCEVSCPETNCLTIKRDIIELEPNWFKDNILAQDKLFACVECGKEFATAKAIEKIAAIMSPIFSSDPVKERSLYCCADCKPKIMMQSYFNQKMEGLNNGK